MTTGSRITSGSDDDELPSRPCDQVTERQAADDDLALTALYDRHYPSLVRLATLLVRDIATAEAIVQESFIALGRNRRRPAGDLALCYLRRGVVYRSRYPIRHRAASNGTASCPAPGRPAAETDAPIALDCAAIVSALRVLPARQREVIVLRYYGDMSETQIAAVMEVSIGALRRHTACAMAALRMALEHECGSAAC
jgi:DNA-directed RNA polymerase specialized sigma24 family protein